MKVKQISVFLENKSGRLAEVTQILAEKQINIRALCIADTTDFGILRLVVSNPEEGYRALKNSGFMVSMTEVLAVEVPDRPGGLAEILAIMGGESINIEYLYSFVKKTPDDALVIFRVEDWERALEVFKKNKINVLDEKKLFSL